MKIEVSVQISNVSTMIGVRTIIKLLDKFFEEFPVTDEHIMIDPAGFNKSIVTDYARLDFHAHQVDDDQPENTDETDNGYFFKFMHPFED